MQDPSRRTSNYSHYQSQSQQDHYRERTIPKKKYHYIGESIDQSARALRRQVRKKVGAQGSQWLLMIFLVGCFLLFFRKPSIFLLLAAISGTIKFLYCRSPLFPLDLAPLFFSVVMIASIYGLPGALLFIVVADLIPYLLGGCSVSWEGFPLYGLYIILGLVGSIAPQSITSVGITLAVFNALGSIIIYRMTGTLEGIGIFNVIMHMFLNILYFMKFAPLILGAL